MTTSAVGGKRGDGVGYQVAAVSTSPLVRRSSGRTPEYHPAGCGSGVLPFGSGEGLAGTPDILEKLHRNFSSVSPHRFSRSSIRLRPLPPRSLSRQHSLVALSSDATHSRQ
jgi:hypothetical protein